MFAKFLICGALFGLAVADVKHLSREYLPAAIETVVTKVNNEYLPPKTKETSSLLQQHDFVDRVELPVLQQDEIEGNDIELDQNKAATKETNNDPSYGNGAYGFNGIPGSYPGAYPNYPGGLSGFPGQGFPGQGFPGQGFPGQGFPGQGFPGQGFPRPGFPGQGFPGQGFPGQGFPGQGFPGQGFPGQGFPGQGFPGQGFPGFVNPGFGGPGFPGQGFPNPAYPNYPIYHTSEQLKQEATPQAQDEKLRLRVASDTVYDSSNGGYLYEKPSLKL